MDSGSRKNLKEWRGNHDDNDEDRIVNAIEAPESCGSPISSESSHGLAVKEPTRYAIITSNIGRGHFLILSSQGAPWWPALGWIAGSGASHSPPYRGYRGILFS